MFFLNLIFIREVWNPLEFERLKFYFLPLTLNKRINTFIQFVVKLFNYLSRKYITTSKNISN